MEQEEEITRKTIAATYQQSTNNLSVTREEVRGGNRNRKSQMRPECGIFSATGTFFEHKSTITLGVRTLINCYFYGTCVRRR